jgi:hypothetical protein
VLNKSLNVLEKKIMKENYITKYSIGRKYYVNENLILEVTDATQ